MSRSSLELAFVGRVFRLVRFHFSTRDHVGDQPHVIHASQAKLRRNLIGNSSPLNSSHPSSDYGTDGREVNLNLDAWVADLDFVHSHPAEGLPDFLTLIATQRKKYLRHA